MTIPRAGGAWTPRQCCQGISKGIATGVLSSLSSPPRPKSTRFTFFSLTVLSLSYPLTLLRGPDSLDIIKATLESNSQRILPHFQHSAQTQRTKTSRCKPLVTHFAETPTFTLGHTIKYGTCKRNSLVAPLCNNSQSIKCHEAKQCMLGDRFHDELIETTNEFCLLSCVKRIKVASFCNKLRWSTTILSQLLPCLSMNGRNTWSLIMSANRHFVYPANELAQTVSPWSFLFESSPVTPIWKYVQWSFSVPQFPTSYPNTVLALVTLPLKCFLFQSIAFVPLQFRTVKITQGHCYGLLLPFGTFFLLPLPSDCVSEPPKVWSMEQLSCEKGKKQWMHSKRFGKFWVKRI